MVVFSPIVTRLGPFTGSSHPCHDKEVGAGVMGTSVGAAVSCAMAIIIMLEDDHNHSNEAQKSGRCKLREEFISGETDV